MTTRGIPSLWKSATEPWCPTSWIKLTSNKEQTSGARTSTGVIDAFIESIRTGTSPAISGESVLPAMKAVFANQLSCEQNKAVDVE